MRSVFPAYAEGMKRTAPLVIAAALAFTVVLAQAQTPGPTVTDIPAPGTEAARVFATRPVVIPAARPEAQPEAHTEVRPPAPPVAPAVVVPKPAPAPVAAAATEVPAGTPIALQLETRLNSQYNGIGDGFAARVMTSVYYEGRDVIPAGSILEGHVMHVTDARPSVAQSELLLKPDLLTLPNGARYSISAEVIQNDAHSPARVDTEGMLREPRGMLATDVHHTEIGSAAGFIGGAVLAGGEGAAVGAGLGAAVAVGIWLVRRRHLVLNPGSHLTVRLQRAIQLRPR